nr:MAG TPA: hypothetical protein [Caudoviricetes sp.]
MHIVLDKPLNVQYNMYVIKRGTKPRRERK